MEGIPREGLCWSGPGPGPAPLIPRPPRGLPQALHQGFGAELKLVRGWNLTLWSGVVAAGRRGMQATLSKIAADISAKNELIASIDGIEPHLNQKMLKLWDPVLCKIPRDRLTRGQKQANKDLGVYDKADVIDVFCYTKMPRWNIKSFFEDKERLGLSPDVYGGHKKFDDICNTNKQTCVIFKVDFNVTGTRGSDFDYFTYESLLLPAPAIRKQFDKCNRALKVSARRKTQTLFGPGFWCDGQRIQGSW